ncbi:hypothetical protein AGLY_001071 [Aphis glycines]|uniref:Uncharacterized protein n=1 Tax=Aphis glycines TaxID=307491 RepID=A0A6G0U8S7_APHGL|nr:hypothetical protein AGLY_001071 [Aphis glycines]
MSMQQLAMKMFPRMKNPQTEVTLAYGLNDVRSLGTGLFLLLFSTLGIRLYHIMSTYGMQNLITYFSKYCKTVKIVSKKLFNHKIACKYLQAIKKICLFERQTICYLMLVYSQYTWVLKKMPIITAGSLEAYGSGINSHLIYYCNGSLGFVPVSYLANPPLWHRSEVDKHNLLILVTFLNKFCEFSTKFKKQQLVSYFFPYIWVYWIDTLRTKIKSKYFPCSLFINYNIFWAQIVMELLDNGCGVFSSLPRTLARLQNTESAQLHSMKEINIHTNTSTCNMFSGFILPCNWIASSNRLVYASLKIIILKMIRILIKKIKCFVIIDEKIFASSIKLTVIVPSVRILTRLTSAPSSLAPSIWRSGLAGDVSSNTAGPDIITLNP